MERTLCYVGLCLGICISATSGSPLAAGFTFQKSAQGISEYTLDANGLDVLLLEDHSSPVVTFMITFHVGSRNEVTGATGATHLLEHMMFKGSTHYNAALGTGFDTMMDRVGAINNATTSLDRTNYYETLPSDQLQLAVQLESDRMRGLLIQERDRMLEMTVVRNEYEKGENDPAEVLDKEVKAAAFIAHPYHHPTIGWRSDIENASIERLRDFYDRYYWPNNATVTIIGDFESDHALGLLLKYFGEIPRSPFSIPILYTEEPRQTGPRRIVVKGVGEVGAVELAFKVPPALREDHGPLEVLAAILNAGKTSRFYRALIDTNLAISTTTRQGFHHDDTLFYTIAMVAPKATHDNVEFALLHEIEKLKSTGVSQDEVNRAIAKVLAETAYQRDGPFAIAGELNECIAVGDWTEYFAGPDKVKAVTAADVVRVARKYLICDQSTTGWFVPSSEAKSDQPMAAPASRAAQTLASRRQNDFREGKSAGTPLDELSSASTNRNEPERGPAAVAFSANETLPKGAAKTELPAWFAKRVHRREVAGTDVLTLVTSIHEVVTIRGSLSGGDVFNPPENSAIANLTAGMLDRGTTTHDKYALAELLETVGATLEFSSGTHVLTVSGKCLRKDIPLVLSLVSEQLRHPRFDSDEFEKLKQHLIGKHRHRMQDPDYRAAATLRRALYAVGHPNRPPEDDQYLADIASASLDQVRAFHATVYGTAEFHLVLVGDVDDAAVDREVAKGFGAWQVGKTIPTVARTPVPLEGRAETVNMHGKTSVTFVIGQRTGLTYTDPGAEPLRFATEVLGGDFFSARLLDWVRNRQGLTYGVFAQDGGDTYADGFWFIEASFAPELLKRGVSATLEQLRKFCIAGITADELNHFKVTLTGSYQVNLTTSNGIAKALLNAIQCGYGPEWLDDYPRRIEALSLGEVNAAIHATLHPEKMVTVTAGTLPSSEK